MAAKMFVSSKPEGLFLICLKLDVEFSVHLKMVTPAWQEFQTA